MTIIPAKSGKVITCTNLQVLPELYQATGFNDLLMKIIEAKVEEKCKKTNFLRTLRQLSAELND